MTTLSAVWQWKSTIPLRGSAPVLVVRFTEFAIELALLFVANRLIELQWHNMAFPDTAELHSRWKLWLKAVGYMLSLLCPVSVRSAGELQSVWQVSPEGLVV